MEKTPEISDENKIMMMLVRIGDEKVEQIDSHIQKMCSHLCGKIETLGSSIAYHFLTCVSNIPQKAFVYAYVLNTMAAQEHEHTSNIVNQIFEMFNEKINMNEDATLLIKFFGALTDTGYLNASCMENLIKQLLELNTKALEESRKNDYFLNLALYGYLFARRAVRKEAGPGTVPEVEGLLDTHVQNRLKIQSEMNGTTDPDSVIDLLWDSIKQSEGNDDTELALENKIYKIYLRPSKEFIQELSNQEIAQVTSLPDIKIISKLPFLSIGRYFELFAQRSIDESDRISYAVSRDLVKSVLLAFADNSYFACQRLVALQGIPLLAYVICDCILEEILKLPAPSKRVIFFSSICVTMMKEFTSDQNQFELGPAIGEAIQMIFGVGSIEQASNDDKKPR